MKFESSRDSLAILTAVVIGSIAFHAGEGEEARTRFMMLTHAERQQVLSFLKSLVAPTAVAAPD